jgi:hypothetical protein
MSIMIGGAVCNEIVRPNQEPGARTFMCNWADRFRVIDSLLQEGLPGYRVTRIELTIAGPWQKTNGRIVVADAVITAWPYVEPEPPKPVEPAPEPQPIKFREFF